MHAEFAAGFVLAAHISLRGGMFAEEHDGKSRRDASRLQRRNVAPGFLIAAGGRSFSVDDDRHKAKI
jgi:hypothetical protein